MTERKEKANKTGKDPAGEGSQSGLGITRRRFIGTGAGALVIPGLSSCRSDTAEQGVELSEEGSSLPQPYLIDADQDQDTILILRHGARLIVNRRDDNGRTIEPGILENPVYFASRGSEDPIPMVPGPTFAVSPDNNIRIRLSNELRRNQPPAKCPDETPDGLHDQNTTNFHTHGLHISPERSTGDPSRYSDNVLLKVTPLNDLPRECYERELYLNARALYRFDIPDFHPPGTHWYHPHKHGSTRDQVEWGMAGAIIVKDPPGSELAALTADRRDKIFVYQELKRRPDTQLNEFTSQESHFFTINGHEKPIISIRPGEVQRWRFINAAVSANGYMRIAVEDPARRVQPEVYQIAMDGLYLIQPGNPQHQRRALPRGLLLAPGNRADLLIKGPPVAGRYQLVDVGHNREGNLAVRPRVLATLWVSGSARNDPFPGLPSVPTYLEDITERVDARRCVRFDVVPKEPPPPDFLIDGEKYSNSRVDHIMKLDHVEEWEVRNYSPGDHPFHIHVNPFLVVERNGQPVDPPVWQDVINVPGAINARLMTGDSVRQYGSVKFLTRIRNFTGRFVLHCHILFHEDMGMMQLVEVHPNQSNAGERNDCSTRGPSGD